MAIELKGYNTIFQNAVYGKDEQMKVPTRDGEKEITVIRVLMPVRFTQPTQEEVIKYIKTLADTHTKIALPKGFQKKGRTLAEALLINLPDQIVSDIKTQKEQCVEFITNATQMAQQGKYVNVTYGTIPLGLASSSIYTIEQYQNALSNPQLQMLNFGGELSIQIQLENDKLPDKKEVDTLLKHCTYGSKTLQVRPSQYDQTKTAGLVATLYEGLDGAKINELRDISEQALDDVASIPLKALHEMILAHRSD